MSIFNFSTKRAGGLRFVKIGRFCFAFCIPVNTDPYDEGFFIPIPMEENCNKRSVAFSTFNAS